MLTQITKSTRQIVYALRELSRARPRLHASIFIIMPGTGNRRGQNDVAVQGTNDSSIVSKCSAASLGYVKDDFLRHFVSKTTRRAPLINRGYYIRAKAINDVIQAFLRQFADEKTQIVSLGAGFDSTYFRLTSDGCLPTTTFFEVDFPQLVQRKAALIRNNPTLLELLQSPIFHDVLTSKFGVCVSSDKYHLLGVDLKNLVALETVFKQSGLDFRIPTLLLSECVITYMDTPSSDALIRWAAESFSNSIFLSYEQVLPNDPFGIVMQKHFKNLNSPLNAIQTYSTIQEHCIRYIEQGWQASDAINMYQYYTHVLSHDERCRVEAIELFDEFEEWHLKCVHYIVVAAFNGKCADCRQELFNGVQPPLSNPDNSLRDDSHNLSACPLIVGSEKDKVGSMPRQFSHASVVVPETQKVLISGGFGDKDRNHSRLEGLLILDVVSKAVTGVPAMVGSEQMGARMHHTITAISPNRFLVYGGRTSPAKPCLDTRILTLKRAASRPTEYSLRRTLHGEEDPSPPPRWRHTADRVRVGGREAVFVCGGRGVDPHPMGDTWLLDVEQEKWERLHLDGPTFHARHSHSATPWGTASSRVVVAGGLGGDSAPLSSVMVLDLEARSCHALQTTPPLHPRYSHTAHIVNDELILVGGVSPVSSAPPSVTIIQLGTGLVQDMNLEVSVPECPLMLHNHTSHWLHEEEGILVIGGGGNCFSFGTHLNKTPVIIKDVLPR